MVTFGIIMCMLLTLGASEAYAATTRNLFLYTNPVVKENGKAKKESKDKKPSKKPVKGEKPTEEEKTEEATTEETTEEMREEIITEEETDLNEEKIAAYEKIAASEAAWLWGQQLSNGAFAFYNTENGSVYINPYYVDALFNLRDTYDELGNIAGKTDCDLRLSALGEK